MKNRLMIGVIAISILFGGCMAKRDFIGGLQAKLDMERASTLRLECRDVKFLPVKIEGENCYL